MEEQANILNLVEIAEADTDYGSAPDGVSSEVWEEWKQWKMKPSDDFIYQVNQGMLGKNTGLGNGLGRINNYLHGTHSARYYLVGGDSGVGKCLGKGTRIIMFDGTLKSVEDIIAGDVLMGPDKTPRNVLSTCTGKEQMYWVRQKRGVDYRVNESHILSLQYTPKPHWRSSVKSDQLHIPKKLRKRAYSLISKSTSEIKNLSVLEYLSAPNKLLLKGWKSPVSFGDKVLAIDPYYLGIWLGDGTSAGTEITNVEEEVLAYLSSIPKIKVIRKDCVTVNLVSDKQLHSFSEAGFFVQAYGSVEEAARDQSTLPEYISRATKSGKVHRGRLWRWDTKDNHLLNSLRQLNLINNKHLPLEVLQSNREFRLAVLAGLIDGDGHRSIENDMVEITQKRKELAEGITMLVRSLGFHCSIKEKIATMKRLDGSIYSSIVYRVTFKHCISIPCLVPRKMAVSSNTKSLSTAIHLEKDTVDDYYGFVIDGDHLFMLEDFTVTHNTTIADFMYVFSAWYDAKRLGRKLRILYCSFELGKLDKIARWVSTIIFYKFGVQIPSDYILGRITGKLPTPEHHRMIIIAHQLLQEMLKDVKVLDVAVNPTLIFQGCVAELEKYGTVIREEVTTEQLKENPNAKGAIKGYICNDPELEFELFIDHLALAAGERGLDTKQLMDLMSRYCISLRNIFRMIIVIIQQFSTDMMSYYRITKKSEDVIAPQRIDFGDSKAPFRDADVVLGIVKPIQFDLTTFKKYNLAKNGGLFHCFVAIYIMKNRYGPSGRCLPQFMDGITGHIFDLPPDPTDILAVQTWYDRARQIEELCQIFSPKND